MICLLLLYVKNMYERNFFLLNIILCDCERYVLRFLWFVCYLFGMYIYIYGEFCFVLCFFGK